MGERTSENGPTADTHGSAACNPVNQPDPNITPRIQNVNTKVLCPSNIAPISFGFAFRFLSPQVLCIKKRASKLNSVCCWL